MNPFAVIMIQIAISLVITAIAARLIKPDGVKKKGLDDFTFPTVSQDRAIPVVFGDVLVEGPNVTWFGDYKSKKIKEGGSLFSPDVVVGHTYFIGMELAISWGSLDEMTELWFGDDIAWQGSVTTDATEFTVDNKELFGGEGEGGGVHALCTFYKGTPEQSANDYMTSQLGEGYPHKGVAKIIWHGPRTEGKNGSGQIGESELIPPIKLRVGHYPNFLGTAYKKITAVKNSGEENQYTAVGANPAEVIYCLLIGRYANVQSTDPVVPILPTNLIDTASFTAAAQTLYNEKMGISFQWQRDTPVRDIIDDIVHHVDGYLSEDSQTGKIRFVLNRQDYDPNTVPVFDESNIVDFESYVRINPTAAVNRMSATFTDPYEAFKPRPITVEDLGNTFEQDMGAPGDIDLHMFHDVDVAIQRTTWELIQLSEGIISGAFKANRDAYSLNIGDPIKLSWEGFGVDGLLVRVVEKVTGSLEDRSITVKFVQDIYGIGTAIYGAPGNTAWQDIVNDPEDITIYEMFEQPRFFRLAYAAPDEHRLMLLAQFPTSDTSHYKASVQFGSAPYVLLSEERSETPSTTLVSDYKQEYGPSYDTVNGIRILGVPPEDMEGSVTAAQIQDDFRHWVLCNGELMAFTHHTVLGDGSYVLHNVYRGLLDTSPQDHKAGDRIWFLSEGISSIDIQFADTETGNIKTLTTAGKGILDAADAGAKSWTINNRDGKPYRPANVQINGAHYPIEITGALVITWAERNKDTATLTKWGDATETPEAGQVTNIRIYDALDSLIHTAAGLTGTSYTYSLAQELADAGFVQNTLRIEIESEIPGEVSHSLFTYTFNRAIGGGEGVSLELDLDTPANPSSADVGFNLDEPA